jgi:predicted transposase/invertase (TIGR01784 family)
MICDFNVFDDSRFIHRFKYADNETVLSDICCIIYVELPKIKDRFNKPFAEMTDDERWTFLIEYIDDEKFSAKAAEFEVKEEYRMAMKVLNTISNDEKQQIGYLSYLMNEMDYIHGMSASMEEGIAKGELKAQLKIAREMALDGMAPKTIAKFTRLPLETIQTILSESRT